MHSSPPLLVVNQLTKRYGSVTVLDNVSISFAAGEIHALLGANGAGAQKMADQLEIRCNSIEQAVGTLSGGDSRTDIDRCWYDSSARNRADRSFSRIGHGFIGCGTGNFPPSPRASLAERV